MKSDGYGAQGTVAKGTEPPGETNRAAHRKRVLIADSDDAARRMLANVVESLARSPCYGLRLSPSIPVIFGQQRIAKILPGQVL